MSFTHKAQEPSRQSKIPPELSSNLLRLILNYFANPVHLKFQKSSSNFQKNLKTPQAPEKFAKTGNKA
jgi:hypothetical protein